MSTTHLVARPLRREEKIRIRRIARLFGFPAWVGGMRFTCACPRCGWRIRCPNLATAWRLSRGHIRKRHAGG